MNMSSGALQAGFTWGKPETKFIWGTARDGSYRLRWPDEKKGGYTVMYHPPLSLFRVFAEDLKPDPKDAAEYHALSFANEYGDILSVPGREYYQLDGEAIGGRRVIRPYAPLRLWRHQIRQMRWAVGLWDQCNDETARETTRRQARKELQIEIETALRDVTTPSCVRMRLNQDMELYLHPVNLLAFMWLTLARLASGEIAEQRCLGCSQYIYTGVGPGLKKTGTLTCSVVCRKWKERHSG
jgi:hypothetical protein